jgi:hypothetical protein
MDFLVFHLYSGSNIAIWLTKSALRVVLELTELRHPWPVIGIRGWRTSGIPLKDLAIGVAQAPALLKLSILGC